MKKIIISLLCLTMGVSAFIGCAKKPAKVNPDIYGEIKVENSAQKNLVRSMQTASEAFDHYIMKTLYNQGTIYLYNKYDIKDENPSDVASVWRYTGFIEMYNSLAKSLNGFKEDKNITNGIDVDATIDYYNSIAKTLVFNGLDQYLGTYSTELTSYTQDKVWTVYGVNRSEKKGNANVNGKENVYDDQMWLIREFIEAYHLTNDVRYLEKAEYLTNYCLDGYDQTINPATGKEFGGITWGPGYTSKHTCSNGPIISPLVWLYDIYKDSNEEIEYYYIDHNDNESRKTGKMKKSEYYLEYAKKVYDFCESTLINSYGVYHDLVGGDNGVQYEKFNDTYYRTTRQIGSPGGKAYTYNSGSVLMGIADLYRVTGDNRYLTAGKSLADSAFTYFAAEEKDGMYSYSTVDDTMWFNLVLLRGYVAMYPYYDTTEHIESFSKAINYAYDNYYDNGFLPRNYVKGWSYGFDGDTNILGMDVYANAAIFAVIAEFEQAIKPNGTNKTVNI